MAYATGGVYQWAGTINSPADLARVIQGEANTPAGQFAVASVIYNRLNSVGSGYVGYGTGNLQAVVTPSQFNGFQPAGANAMSLANDIWNGNAPSGGTTGNAVFYAAPSTNNAAWANPNYTSGANYFANATNIGGNYFSDSLSGPSSNFVAPVYTDGSAGGAVTDPNASLDASQSTTTAGNPGSSSAPADPNAVGIDAGNGTYGTFGVSTDPTGQYANVGTQAAVDSATAANQSATTQAAKVSSGTDNLIVKPDATTVPLAIDQQTKYLVQSQGVTTNIIADATLKAGKTQAAATTAASDSASKTSIGLFGAAQTYIADLFTRFGVIILGVVFVAAGLFMLARPEVKQALAKVPLPVPV